MLQRSRGKTRAAAVLQARRPGQSWHRSHTRRVARRPHRISVWFRSPPSPRARVARMPSPMAAGPWN